MTTGLLTRRVERLEAVAHSGGGGCAVCAAWPPVQWVNDWQGRGDSHPVRCPACGRSRQVVEWVNDWRRRE